MYRTQIINHPPGERAGVVTSLPRHAISTRAILAHQFLFAITNTRLYGYVSKRSSIFIPGSSEHPLLPAGRYIVWLILLFTFAIYQFYSASIVGSLLMVKPKSIRTLRDLIDSSLDLGIEDIIYNRDFFSVSAAMSLLTMLEGVFGLL